MFSVANSFENLKYHYLKNYLIILMLLFNKNNSIIVHAGSNSYSTRHTGTHPELVSPRSHPFLTLSDFFSHLSNSNRRKIYREILLGKIPSPSKNPIRPWQGVSIATR